MAAAPHSPFPPVVREALLAWFGQYGNNSLFEIEMRVQEVGAGGFERLLTALQSHKGWASAEPPALSLDIMHATGVRETRDMTPGVSKPAVYLRKQKGNDLKVSTPSGYDVRFQVSSEAEASADASPAHLFRHKQRYTFVHKNLFKFELTRVKQGPTSDAALSADTTHEVEIEFCGQANAEAHGPPYLADSMLMKAADVLHHLASGGAAGSAAATNRPVRSADGPLRECDELELADGAEVALEPSGHGVALRFSGEMPAQLCKWLYSHTEADGRIHVMSEVANIGNDHFPLFYFSGTVPKSAVVRRKV